MRTYHPVSSVLISASALWHLLLCPPVSAAEESVSPRIWILAGLPGDAERAGTYLASVESLRESLNHLYGVPKGHIRILFGKDKMSRYSACNRANLLAELKRVCDASSRKEPLWLIFMGHANSLAKDAAFNIAGDDIKASEIGQRLGGVSAGSPLVCWFTTSASGHFLFPARGSGRVLLAATPLGGTDNETEFPHALARVLQDPASADTNYDGFLSVSETVTAVRSDVDRMYAGNGWLRTEAAVIDGDGNGEGSADPGGIDYELAEHAGLRYGEPGKRPIQQ